MDDEIWLDERDVQKMHNHRKRLDYRTPAEIPPVVVSVAFGIECALMEDTCT